MTAKQQKGLTAPDGSEYVTITDGAGNLGSLSATLSSALPAGTNIIGKVGFDTSNNVANIVGSRPFVFYGAINNAQTTYTVGGGNTLVVGGLVRVGGFAADQVFPSAILKVKCLLSDWTSGTNASVLFFDDNPTGSTIADNTAIASVAADLDITHAQVAAVMANGGAGWINTWTFTAPVRWKAGSDGYLNFAFGFSSTTVLGAINKLRYRLDCVC